MRLLTLTLCSLLFSIALGGDFCDDDCCIPDGDENNPEEHPDCYWYEEEDPFDGYIDYYCICSTCCTTCTSDSDCNICAGEYCDPQNDYCLTNVDNACSGSTPACSDNTCVQCTANSDCATTDNEENTSPYCNTETNTCNECLVNSHCAPDLCHEFDDGNNACLSLAEIEASTTSDAGTDAETPLSPIVMLGAGAAGIVVCGIAGVAMANRSNQADVIEVKGDGVLKRGGAGAGAGGGGGYGGASEGTSAGSRASIASDGSLFSDSVFQDSTGTRGTDGFSDGMSSASIMSHGMSTYVPEAQPRGRSRSKGSRNGRGSGGRKRSRSRNGRSRSKSRN